MIGVALVIDRLLGDFADEPVGCENAGEMNKRQRRRGRGRPLGQVLLDGLVVTLVRLALVRQRAGCKAAASSTMCLGARQAAAAACLAASRISSMSNVPVLSPPPRWIAAQHAG